MALKVPFRQQASKYDCFPTSLINGLSYLFDRNEVPPSAIHRIYKNSLDQCGYCGTSQRAIEEIGVLLNGYEEDGYKNFSIESQFIVGSRVHLGPKSKIIDCIKSNGVALIRIHLTENEWHYILAFDTDENWLYCYDPGPRSKRYLNSSDVIFGNSASEQEPNLIINHNWLDKTVEAEGFLQSKTSDHKYIFGPKNERECLLLRKLK